MRPNSSNHQYACHKQHHKTTIQCKKIHEPTLEFLVYKTKLEILNRNMIKKV